MLRALTVLEEQTENKKLAAVLGQVRGDVEAGISLSDRPREAPKVFSPLYINMVRAGEIGVSSTRSSTVRHAAREGRPDQAGVKSAMVYPLMIASFALIVLTGMVLFLIRCSPACISRWATQAAHAHAIMVVCSDTMRSWKGAIVVVVVIALIVIIRKLKRTDKGTEVWTASSCTSPWASAKSSEDRRARFSRTLEPWCRAACPSCRPSRSPGQVGRQRRHRARHEGGAGERQGRPDISEPLKNVSVFPDMVVQMISVGEETALSTACCRRWPTSTKTRSTRR